jgi:ABC-type uncharacterized transport system ATPase subunit
LAIEFIHQQIVALRDQGKAICFISVEFEEAGPSADRIAVMSRNAPDQGACARSKQMKEPASIDGR